MRGRLELEFPAAAGSHSVFAGDTSNVPQQEPEVAKLSGGVAVIESLNMLEGVPLKGWNDPQSVHMVAETMRRIFADRAAYLADPDFSDVPVAGLTSACYAKERASTIDPAKASSSTSVKAGDPRACGKSASSRDLPQTIVSLGEGPHTTHFSVVDAAGNAVASTYTLNNSYGSHVTSSAGFLLNDEMDDFTTQPGVPNALYALVQSDANAIAPGHRPLSSMTPTILLRDGKLSFVTGSPGGSLIINVVLQVAVDVIDRGMDIASAVSAPRVHNQWMPDLIFAEPGVAADLIAALEARGDKVMVRRLPTSANSILVAPTGLVGAADPRTRGALAAGY
jgi:gamma-glutamyltranspeptidase/glutathione hydrolase